MNKSDMMDNVTITAKKWEWKKMKNSKKYLTVTNKI